MKFISASLNHHTYLSGQPIELTLSFDTRDIDIVSNISINFYRVEVERNQFAFGFGAKPMINGNSLTVSQKIPASCPPGLYLVHHATICKGDSPESTDNEHVKFPPIFLAVQTAAEAPMSTEELETLKSELDHQRGEYMNHPIQTEKVINTGASSHKFRVLIFGVGCLLHAHQQLKGYSIIPLGLGLSHKRMLDIVNSALKREGLDGLPFDGQAEQRFEGSTPTFLVRYSMVEAIDHVDALDYCRNHSNTLFQILGLDRGQMPREFACFALQYDTINRWHMFQMPGYSGNLVSDFNPVSTANRIESLLPKLQASAFLRLITKTYAEATAETDYGFSLLRYWAVLELVADKQIKQDGSSITHPDGTIILNPKGNPKTVNSKDGRVYTYILSNGAYKSHGTYNKDGKPHSFLIGYDSSHPAYKPGMEIFSLWEIVQAVYVIRNSVAHEGQFDSGLAATGSSAQKLAARLKETGGHALDPLQFVRHQAESALAGEAKSIQVSIS